MFSVIVCQVFYPIIQYIGYRYRDEFRKKLIRRLYTVGLVY